MIQIKENKIVKMKNNKKYNGVINWHLLMKKKLICNLPYKNGERI